LIDVGSGRGLVFDLMPWLIFTTFFCLFLVFYGFFFSSFPRGTGFTTTERLSLSLRGLIPPRQLKIEDQARRIMERVRSNEEPIKKYEALSALQDR
jgi:hypothetical protein